MLNLEYTRHAVYAMAERRIPAEWVEFAETEPALRMGDPGGADAERFFRPFPQYGGRMPRVVVNTRAVPWRVISAFFDRSMKGK